MYEVEFGQTLGSLIELAGGITGTGHLGAVMLGGAAGVFVGAQHLDMPLTFEHARARNATLGSGVVLVFDDDTDFRAISRRIARFFRDESVRPMRTVPGPAPSARRSCWPATWRAGLSRSSSSTIWPAS